VCAGSLARVSPTPLTDDELAFLEGALDLARNGPTAELVTLVDQGLPVNLSTPAGDTLLVLAAYHGHAATVEALLARGADTERVNDRGQTALGAATFRQHLPVVRALLAAGADPSGGTQSALDVARFFDLPDARALLEAGR